MNREQLRAALEATASPKPSKVTVPGWGEIWVRPVLVEEVEEQTADAEQSADKHRLARSAARVICGENGERLFDPNDQADVALLAKQPWALLRRVLAASNPEVGNA